MSDFMFLFRGGDHSRLSPEEMQHHFKRWGEWIAGLRAQGAFKAGEPLQAESRLVSGADAMVTDGPFAESKESVAGYLIVLANNLDDAVALAKGCPDLGIGASVEVRPIMPM